MATTGFSTATNRFRDPGEGPRIGADIGDVGRSGAGGWLVATPLPPEPGSRGEVRVAVALLKQMDIGGGGGERSVPQIRLHDPEVQPAGEHPAGGGVAQQMPAHLRFVDPGLTQIALHELSE